MGQEDADQDVQLRCLGGSRRRPRFVSETEGSFGSREQATSRFRCDSNQPLCSLRRITSLQAGTCRVRIEGVAELPLKIPPRTDRQAKPVKGRVMQA